MGTAETPVASDFPCYIGKLSITTENRHYRAHQVEISPKNPVFEDIFEALKEKSF